MILQKSLEREQLVNLSPLISKFISMKKLDNFVFLDQKKMLGKGGFSAVHKVKSVVTGKIYAMKVVDDGQLRQ